LGSKDHSFLGTPKKRRNFFMGFRQGRENKG
jgi:hypothetical protein